MRFDSDYEVIYAYTRAQALSDGILVDVSALAREASFRIPLAVTETVYAYLDPSAALVDEGQSFVGRAWDLLSILHSAIKASHTSDVLLFDVLFVLNPGSAPKPVSLKAICGPGDTGEPVLTVMMPWES